MSVLRPNIRATFRRALPPLAGVALVAALAVAARHVSWRQVIRIASGIPLPALVLAVLVSVVQAFILATRLWAVFPAGERPSWTRVARAYGFGQLANACVPARAGDVVKVVAIRDESPASTANAAGAVLADKALEILALLLLALVLAPALFLGGIAATVRLGGVAIAVVLAAGAGAYVLHRARPAYLAKARHGVTATWQSLRGLATPRRLAMASALACVPWIADASSMMLLAHPLGVHLSLPHAIGALFVLNVGLAIPVSVANVGAYEAASVLGLSAYGATVAQGFAIGILHHVVQIVTVVLFALAFWVHDRLTPRRARVLAAAA